MLLDEQVVGPVGQLIDGETYNKYYAPTNLKHPKLHASLCTSVAAEANNHRLITAVLPL